MVAFLIKLFANGLIKKKKKVNFKVLGLPGQEVVKTTASMPGPSKYFRIAPAKTKLLRSPNKIEVKHMLLFYNYSDVTLTQKYVICFYIKHCNVQCPSKLLTQL